MPSCRPLGTCCLTTHINRRQPAYQPMTHFCVSCGLRAHGRSSPLQGAWTALVRALLHLEGHTFTPTHAQGCDATNQSNQPTAPPQVRPDYTAAPAPAAVVGTPPSGRATDNHLNADPWANTPLGGPRALGSNPSSAFVQRLEFEVRSSGPGPGVLWCSKVVWPVCSLGACLRVTVSLSDD